MKKKKLQMGPLLGVVMTYLLIAGPPFALLAAAVDATTGQCLLAGIAGPLVLVGLGVIERGWP
jgi:hypothetical protein